MRGTSGTNGKGFFGISIRKKIKEKLPVAWYQIDGASAETRSGFIADCAERNRVPAIVILIMILAMESLMVFFYVANAFIKKGTFFPQYIYMYTSMIAASVCFLTAFLVKKHTVKGLMVLELAMVAVIGIWSAIFSAFDVINGFSSYLFIQLMIINTVVFKLEPVRHCIVNGVSYAVYFVLVLTAHLGITVTFAELVNPFFMVVAACVILILNNRTKFRWYMNRKLVEDQNRKLEFYANNDYLTKIPNRKSIIEYLNEITSGGHSSIICMMIDIDNFKLYNDTYGHITGDNCLVKLTCAIEKYVNAQGGKIGRYGGEEFLVLFPDKREDEAVSAANELVRIAREQNIPFPANQNSSFPVVTISVGLYVHNNMEETDRTKLLLCADHALYEAKKKGRNRVVVAYR